MHKHTFMSDGMPECRNYSLGRNEATSQVYSLSEVVGKPESFQEK